MLALIGNLDFSELVIVFLAAVLVFGDRLPKLAGRVGAEAVKLQREFDRRMQEAVFGRDGFVLVIVFSLIFFLWLLCVLYRR